MTLTSSWQSPSNIALVKYWGKHGIQLPRNPSLSFTLSACRTEMKLEVTLHAATPGVTVFYDGQPKPAFEPKIKSFFQRLDDRLPWLKTASVFIDSINTFPHGAGIASSASALSAMALCLADIDNQISQQPLETGIWLQDVSRMSRLGSGSASRSVFPVASVWGKSKSVAGSSDEYAIPWQQEIAPVFHDYQDTILIVSASEKSVSSTMGHDMMNDLPYAPARYKQADQHLSSLVEIMKTGEDPGSFISICESEALQLHALMMSGPNPFMLMAPNTLAIIQNVWRFRKETNIPVCFTLDAGPNVHLLYPKSYHADIHAWVNSELISFCAEGTYISDQAGAGPSRI